MSGWKILAALTLCLVTTSAFAQGNSEELPQGKPFQNLQNQINVINMTIDELTETFNAKFAALDARNDAQDELIAAIQVALSIVQERAAANEDDIEALELATSLNAQLIDTLTNRLGQLESSTDQRFADVFARHQTLNVLINVLRRDNVALRRDNVALRLDTDANTAVLDQYIDELQAVDRLLPSFCPFGQVVRGINFDGTPSCTEFGGNAVYTRSAILTEFSFCDTSIPVIGCVDTDYYQTGSAFCSFGDYATGGGFSVGGFGNIGGNKRRLVSQPSSSRGWFVQSIQTGGSQTTGFVYVKCLSIAS